MSSVSHLAKKYTRHPLFSELLKCIETGAKCRTTLKNLPPRLSVLPAAALISQVAKPFFFCFFDKERAAYFYNDLQRLLPEHDISFFPSSFRRSSVKTAEAKADSGSVVLRTEILNKMAAAKAPLIVSYTEAVCEKVPQLAGFRQNSFELKVGQTVDQETLTEFLNEYGFQRQDFVYQPGQYSIRGSIVDIFSYSNDYPFRLDFFDDEIESMRTFDIVSQLSKAKFDRITVIPDIQALTENEEHIPLFEYFQQETILWLDDIAAAEKKADAQMPDAGSFISGKDLVKGFEQFSTVELHSKSFFDADKVLEFNIKEQPAFNKNFELLANDLIKKSLKGYQQYILADHEDQLNRIRKILYSDEIRKSVGKYDSTLIATDEDSENIYRYEPVIGNLSFGFFDEDLKLTAYTDHRIFGRYYKFNLKTASFTKSREAISLKELNDLKPGDYVVHADHGIGRFGGLHITEQNGKRQEAVRLYYKDNDILLVNIHNLHKISKYAGKETGTPKVHKLGGKTWANLKSRTKKKVKDIAEQLIKLYAKRKAQKGFAFSGDTFLQHALESSFIYEDTPDQATATEAVKADMESESPMDRLIIGDVGFGKTEIAVRAAFKAAYDGKQTAVLVPTTVLTYQHYKTFRDRFKEFGVKVDFLSRFKSRKDIKDTLQRLQDGKIDVIVGTHRLISKDVEFHDLGLLVVDEEQKFGVSVKDRLKEIKLNVDTLTMTATPIPRTLQFSLNGARDMSIIATPPPNRYPIETELHVFDKEIIKEALQFEISRNGQAFFIHNRIENIEEVRDMLHRLLPHISTGVVHGRMKPTQVEEVMTGFINEEFGVLIATSIIESGLDIPNANTIIINNAQNFGLSDLHQLRGRVGRSDRKAFCYLLAPPKHAVSNDARRRLEALENFSDLGSGYNIAMRDLDIRGAGNLLGGEQSGFISDVGFETYHQILDEALNELKEKEYRTDFSAAAERKLPPKGFKYVSDCNIDTDLEILFPTSYIENITERLKLYRELNKVQNDNELESFRQELTDRFGNMPKETEELLKALKLRRLGMELGMEKIFLKNDYLRAYFVSDQESSYYASPTFSAILAYVQKYPKSSRLAEKNHKLTLTVKNVKSVDEALTALRKIEIDR